MGQSCYCLFLRVLLRQMSTFDFNETAGSDCSYLKHQNGSDRADDFSRT